MNEIDCLLDAYSGDEDWNRFVDVFRPEWERLDDEKKSALVDLIDEDFAIILSWVVPEHEIEWWRSPIPALDGHIPAKIHSEHSQGTMIMRALMMRLPT
ncbi:hypothetical protein [Aliihoeflea sp. PC F10.4]